MRIEQEFSHFNTLKIIMNTFSKAGQNFSFMYNLH